MKLAYLIKNKSLTLNLTLPGGQVTRTFAPYAEMSDIPKDKVDKLLKAVVTVGGCCGKPSKTMPLFATEEQLASGEREWIT